MKWIKKRYDKFKSLDGKREYELCDYICPTCNYKTANQAKDFNYCPICGEKVDKDGE